VCVIEDMEAYPDTRPSARLPRLLSGRGGIGAEAGLAGQHSRRSR
jgi:hypothetical protein